MNLNWSNRVIKYVLFVFNFVFVVTGIIMIAVGASVKAFYQDYDLFLSGNYFSLPNMLIAIGALIFFISFFGCCGAMKESWFMIFIFSILLGIIFIMEFSAGIAGYVLRDQTTSYLRENLINSMKDYKRLPEEANSVTIMWDLIQYEFECCGANGPDDWETPFGTTVIPIIVTVTDANHKPVTDANNHDVTTYATTKMPNPSLPGSCCKSRPGATGTLVCSTMNNSTTTYYTRGCVAGFGDYLKSHAVTLGGVGIAIAFLQLFGVIFACHLTRQLKNGFYST